MRFRVLKQFDWDGRRYERGGSIRINDSHPRVGAMINKGGFMVRDPSFFDKVKPHLLEIVGIVVVIVGVILSVVMP